MKYISVFEYINKLNDSLKMPAIQKVEVLCDLLLDGWRKNKHVYICGNGGSAANATHIANDFIYGAGINNGAGLRVEALSSNTAVITCLANDLGYDSIYSEQLKVKAGQGDILIVLSGSGNSKNIVKAIEVGNRIGMETVAILGFSGGRSKEIAKLPIHFEVDDMQIAEDLQLIVGHMCMQWLCKQNVMVNHSGSMGNDNE